MSLPTLKVGSISIISLSDGTAASPPSNIWPNVPAGRLVELCATWARERGMHAVVVFDGRAPEVLGESCEVVGTSGESADDWIVRAARATTDFWLVTSDRGFRNRVGARAARRIGGGEFVRALVR